MKRFEGRTAFGEGRASPPVRFVAALPPYGIFSLAARSTLPHIVIGGLGQGDEEICGSNGVRGGQGKPRPYVSLRLCRLTEYFLLRCGPHSPISLSAVWAKGMKRFAGSNGVRGGQGKPRPYVSLRLRCAVLPRFCGFCMNCARRAVTGATAFRVGQFCGFGMNHERKAVAAATALQGTKHGRAWRRPRHSRALALPP
jgi:hypothetical protein